MVEVSKVSYTKKLDDDCKLGIPYELLTIMGWNSGTELEIFRRGSSSIVLLQKSMSCSFCNAPVNKAHYLRDKVICSDCINEIKNLP